MIEDERLQNASSASPEARPQFILDAMDLIEQGRHKEAAELMIANYKKALPEGHPGKEGPSGVMIGEQVSQLSNYEDRKQKIYEGTRFVSMMKRFESIPADFLGGTMFFLTQQRPDLISGFTEYMEQVLANKDLIAAGKTAIAPSQTPRSIT